MTEENVSLLEGFREEILALGGIITPAGQRYNDCSRPFVLNDGQRIRLLLVSEMIPPKTKPTIWESNSKIFFSPPSFGTNLVCCRESR